MRGAGQGQEAQKQRMWYSLGAGHGCRRDREARELKPINTYQNATNDVAQMGDVVDVGQGTGDEDVFLARLGQNWSVFAGHFCCSVWLMSCCRWAAGRAVGDSATKDNELGAANRRNPNRDI